MDAREDAGHDAVTGPIPTVHTTEGTAAQGQTAQGQTAQTGTADDLVIEAIDIGVRATWGHIYGPTSLRVRAGGVTVLVGSGGRGRTALLLTLAGRMKPSSGTLHAFGRTDDARHLFSQAAIADVDEVDGIDQTIRVSDVVTEQIRWAAPWYKWVPPSRPADLERLCRPVFGDLSLPSMDAYVEELPELTGALFRIAMANVRRPPLLVVGGVDRLARIESAHTLLARLVALGREQTVITADVNGVFPDLGVRDAIEVHHLTDDEFVRLEQQDRN